MARRTRQELICLFLFGGKPFGLSYEFRKKHSGYKEDLPILKQLIKEGLVVQEQKTTKEILFRYVGPEQ